LPCLGAPDAPTSAPLLENLRLAGRTDQSLDLVWESTLTTHEIDYRPEKASSWLTVRSVRETSYNLIMLEPAMRYEARVRGVGASGETLTSAALSAQTSAPGKPALFEGYELLPTRHLDTFTSSGGVWYPTAEYAEGFLWAVEYYGGSIHLSKVTTDSRQTKASPNLIHRDFTSAHPNDLWLSDITYIPTREGWLYLAAVLDAYSRALVGWAMSRNRLTGSLPRQKKR
jgi:hypothetical protein